VKTYVEKWRKMNFVAKKLPCVIKNKFIKNIGLTKVSSMISKNGVVREHHHDMIFYSWNLV
jgi:type IV secretory pathway VirD2 relaxase